MIPLHFYSCRQRNTHTTVFSPPYNIIVVIVPGPARAISFVKKQALPPSHEHAPQARGQKEGFSRPGEAVETVPPESLPGAVQNRSRKAHGIQYVTKRFRGETQQVYTTTKHIEKQSVVHQNRLLIHRVSSLFALKTLHTEVAGEVAERF